jgi:predicted transcriptional regulator
MAMTLRLDEPTNEALRARAQAEGRSMQEIVRTAVLEYVERHAKEDLLRQVLDQELPRYDGALRRLGQ